MTAVSFLVQTVASVSIALLVVAVGFVLNVSAEHRKWLRQARLELYSEFIEKVRMFDRRAKRVALWWRPGEHPDKRIAALQNEQVAIAQLYERIRLVGSKNRASEAETITQIVGKIVYVDEEEHGALAFIEPDSTLVDVHIETFSSGARADLKADGMSRFYRWRQRRGN